VNKSLITPFISTSPANQNAKKKRTLSTIIGLLIKDNVILIA